jgi:hypothetical protein
VGWANVADVTYTEWFTADSGYRWREKLSGFECIHDGEDIAGDFCDECGDCVVCYGFDGFDGHYCRVIEYDFE